MSVIREGPHAEGAVTHIKQREKRGDETRHHAELTPETDLIQGFSTTG